MKRVVSARPERISFLRFALIGCIFALFLGAVKQSGANPPAAGAATAGPLLLRVQSELPASPRRNGLAAHFTADAAYFWGCSGPCAARTEGGLTVEIPKEAKSGRRRIEVLGTKEDPVLWVRWGTDERFYSMIVMGAAREAKDNGPALVLKGWAGEKSEQKTALVKDADGGLTLALAPEESFCGRLVSRKIRVLRPAEGRFVAVRAPVLAEKEREGALRREARPWTGAENTLFALDPKGEYSAPVPVDGDRGVPWDGAFEFTELKIPEGLAEGQWIFEFSEALKEPTALYVVVSEKVYQAEFNPSESKRYALSLDDNQGKCVALVQPRTPAPLAEIMGTNAAGGQQTTAQLVSDLNSAPPGITDALLRMRGAEAGREIARNYGRMSPAVQARAFGIAQKLPRDAALSVFVQAVLAGGNQAAEAALLLRAAGSTGSKALLDHIKEGESAGDSTLIDVLAQIDPVFAARYLPPLLGDELRSRRFLLREALGRVVKVAEARDVLSEWFSTSTPSRRLSPRAQVELLRALEPDLAHLDGAMGALRRAAEPADFTRAYLLTPLLVKNFAVLEGSSEVLDRWLRGEVRGTPDDLEKAALAVGVLDALLEHGDTAARTALNGSLNASLSSENMRVRRAALFNIARTQTNSGPADEILHLLARDPFPQVRASAALAVPAVSGPTWGERTERALLRRLRKEEDASVRRSIVRALSAGSGEAVVEGVRRSFEKDEDYAVRAEAAVSLGKLCDVDSLGALTARARELGTGLTEDGPIELGLSSVTALAYLAPADINKRLAPLLSTRASRLTRQQVLGRIEAVRASSDSKSCRQ